MIVYDDEYGLWGQLDLAQKSAYRRPWIRCQRQCVMRPNWRGSLKRVELALITDQRTLRHVNKYCPEAVGGHWFDDFNLKYQPVTPWTLSCQRKIEA